MHTYKVSLNSVDSIPVHIQEQRIIVLHVLTRLEMIGANIHDGICLLSGDELKVPDGIGKVEMRIASSHKLYPLTSWSLTVFVGLGVFEDYRFDPDQWIRRFCSWRNYASMSIKIGEFYNLQTVNSSVIEMNLNVHSHTGKSQVIVQLMDTQLNSYSDWVMLDSEFYPNVVIKRPEVNRLVRIVGVTTGSSHLTYSRLVPDIDGYESPKPFYQT